MPGKKPSPKSAPAKFTPASLGNDEAAELLEKLELEILVDTSELLDCAGGASELELTLELTPQFEHSLDEDDSLCVTDDASELFAELRTDELRDDEEELSVTVAVKQPLNAKQANGKRNADFMMLSFYYRCSTFVAPRPYGFNRGIETPFS